MKTSLDNLDLVLGIDTGGTYTYNHDPEELTNPNLFIYEADGSEIETNELDGKYAQILYFGF